MAMARRASGGEWLEEAQACLTKAKTVEELRQAQAVVLPLAFGLTLEQTAQAIGVSVGWACQLRTRFARGQGVPGYGSSKRGGRRRENMTREEEAAFLAPFFDKAKVGGILIVGEIKQALDARLGRKVALASAYNLLHRHGWRKLAPDKRHPQADLAAQEDWKKNSPSASSKSTGSGKPKGRSG
jgi:transposase